MPYDDRKCQNKVENVDDDLLGGDAQERYHCERGWATAPCLLKLGLRRCPPSVRLHQQRGGKKMGLSSTFSLTAELHSPGAAASSLSHIAAKWHSQNIWWSPRRSCRNPSPAPSDDMPKQATWCARSKREENRSTASRGSPIRTSGVNRGTAFGQTLGLESDCAEELRVPGCVSISDRREHGQQDQVNDGWPSCPRRGGQLPP